MKTMSERISSVKRLSISEARDVMLTHNYGAPSDITVDWDFAEISDGSTVFVLRYDDSVDYWCITYLGRQVTDVNLTLHECLHQICIKDWDLIRVVAAIMGEVVINRAKLAEMSAEEEVTHERN